MKEAQPVSGGGDLAGLSLSSFYTHLPPYCRFVHSSTLHIVMSFNIGIISILLAPASLF